MMRSSISTPLLAMTAVDEKLRASEPVVGLAIVEYERWTAAATASSTFPDAPPRLGGGAVPAAFR